MLDVRDYINEHHCLTTVSADYNPFEGDLIPYPYLVKGGFFDVSLNGKSNDKHHLTLDELVELLLHPEHHPAARIRCKPNRPGTSPNGRRVLSKMGWEPLRQRLTAEGLIPGTTDPHLAGGQDLKSTQEASASPASTDETEYQVDPARLDERKRALLTQAVRPGQQGFRQRLIELAGGALCVISGCCIASIVQAAHLMPYLGETDNHPANGLLLRADLHLLFDRGLLGIDPTTRLIHLHPTVVSDPHYARYQARRVHTPYVLSEPALGMRWRWYQDGELQ